MLALVFGTIVQVLPSATPPMLPPPPQAMPLAPPPTPSPSPTLTPAPTPTSGRPRAPVAPVRPLGMPRQFSRPEAVPISPQRIDVIISGPPHDPTPAPSLFPDPKSWPVGLPSLREPDGSSAIDLVVSDLQGVVVARGIPNQIAEGGYEWFERESFMLDRALAPSPHAYTVAARYRDDPAYEGSSRYLVSDVPAVEPHEGSAYILTFPNGAPVSTILYVRSIERDGDRTFLTLRTRGAHRVQETVVLPQDASMLGPMVISSDIADVRRQYLGTDATVAAFLECYDVLGETAHVALQPGKHVHIDLIARAAGATTWLPNDPQMPVSCYGACDPVAGTFVESPLIVGFGLQQSDVRIIPPTVITHLYAFHGPCVRGYIMLRDSQELRSILNAAQ